MTDHIWIEFAENGNIRKWQSAPFDGGTEFVIAEKWYASNRAWHTSDAAREKAEEDAAFWKASFQSESKARVELADELAGLKALAAAIGAGGQAVVWQIGNDGAVYRTYSEARKHVDGWAKQNTPCDEPRPLFAHPAPSGQAVADDPVSFQWKTIDGWVECNASGSQQQRREYAQSMARQIGLGYRELYALSQPHPVDERVVEALAAHTNWELTHGPRDPSNENEDHGWCVRSVNGGRNDREWTLIGFGWTPVDAIRAALSAKDGR